MKGENFEVCGSFYFVLNMLSIDIDIGVIFWHRFPLVLPIIHWIYLLSKWSLDRWNLNWTLLSQLSWLNFVKFLTLSILIIIRLIYLTWFFIDVNWFRCYDTEFLFLDYWLYLALNLSKFKFLMLYVCNGRTFIGKSSPLDLLLWLDWKARYAMLMQ